MQPSKAAAAAAATAAETVIATGSDTMKQLKLMTTAIGKANIEIDRKIEEQTIPNESVSAYPTPVLTQSSSAPP